MMIAAYVVVSETLFISHIKNSITIFLFCGTPNLIPQTKWGGYTHCTRNKCYRRHQTPVATPCTDILTSKHQMMTTKARTCHRPTRCTLHTFTAN